MNSRSSVKGAAKVKAAILGKDYELSLVLCGDALSRRLNRTYRGKDKPTNVLAFPLSKTSGEIFINRSRLGEWSELQLLIHGCLHLKGMRHSAKMEREERRFLKLFNGATSRSRHRHRQSDRKDGHRRRNTRGGTRRS